MAALADRLHTLSRMPPSQLWAEASRVLPRWVCLLLVLAIGWQVAKTILLLFPAGEPAAPPPAPVLRQSTTEQPSADVNRVVSAHLFGEPGAEALPPDETVDAPETQLSLQLRGTIAGTEGQKTLAIIAERGGEERVYEVGDAVPGGATLHQVRSDQVILRRAGRLEALKLPRSEELVGTRRTSAVPRSTSPAARVATVQEIVQQGGASLTEVIRPQPVFKDGRQQGYRVYPGRQRQQFAELGLRPGDLVTQINGMALDDPAEGMEIFRSLADATSVSVTVERNGQTEILTLDTSALQQAPPGDGNPTE